MNLVKIQKPSDHYYPNNLVNDLFNHLWDTDRIANTCEETSVNIYETEKNFRLEILTPGYDKNEIEILVEKNQLIIKSDYKEVEKTDKYKSVHIEFSKVGFEKRYRLSEKLNTEAITAEFKNGILTVTIPKLKEEEQKTIRKVKIA